MLRKADIQNSKFGCEFASRVELKKIDEGDNNNLTCLSDSESTSLLLVVMDNGFVVQ
jgi:hypothetical protein